MHDIKTEKLNRDGYKLRKCSSIYPPGLVSTDEVQKQVAAVVFQPVKADFQAEKVLNHPERLLSHLETVLIQAEKARAQGVFVLLHLVKVLAQLVQ